jgi:hypothetical protein
LGKNWSSRNFNNWSSIIVSSRGKAANSLREIGHSPSNEEEDAFRITLVLLTEVIFCDLEYDSVDGIDFPP